MADQPDPANRYRLPSLSDPRGLAGPAVIGVIVLGIAAAFAWVAGWLSPERLSPARMVDTLESLDGTHAGFRRAHAKGVCVAGTFESNGAGVKLSRAAVFRPGKVPVIGRFALASGVPDLDDGGIPVRSLALRFLPPGGDEWRTGMNNIPVFVARDAASFRELSLAARPDPATGKPDPDRMKAFLGTHPETAHAFQMIGAKPQAAGFGDDTYSGLNAFRFIDAAGTATSVRWAMMPAAQPTAALPKPDAAADKNRLFDALAAAFADGPLQWHLVATIAQAGDPTDDATAAWPQEREHVDLGTLTLDHIEAEAPGNCRDITFDPLVLPDGIAPSDDPLLSARSGAYSESLRRRDGEAKTPSAVQPAARKGA
ncbi:MAG TPA: catalase family peroxidase [Stellaceae bacterium]|nr:catalase family peroxidase [Stellaceae bacterium]